MQPFLFEASRKKQELQTDNTSSVICAATIKREQIKETRAYTIQFITALHRYTHPTLEITRHNSIHGSKTRVCIHTVYSREKYPPKFSNQIINGRACTIKSQLSYHHPWRNCKNKNLIPNRSRTCKQGIKSRFSQTKSKCMWSFTIKYKVYKRIGQEKPVTRNQSKTLACTRESQWNHERSIDQIRNGWF